MGFNFNGAGGGGGVEKKVDKAATIDAYNRFTDNPSLSAVDSGADSTIDSGIIYVYDSTGNDNIFYEYDTSTGTITDLSDPTADNYGMIQADENGSIFFVDSNGDAEEYSISGDSWSSITNTSISSVQTLANESVIDGDDIYYTIDGDFKKYDISADSHTSLTQTNLSLGLNFALFKWDGTIYATSGGSIDEYDISGDSWSEFDGSFSTNSFIGGAMQSGDIFKFIDGMGSSTHVSSTYDMSSKSITRENIIHTPVSFRYTFIAHDDLMHTFTSGSYQIETGNDNTPLTSDAGYYKVRSLPSSVSLYNHDSEQSSSTAILVIDGDRGVFPSQNSSGNVVLYE